MADPTAEGNEIAAEKVRARHSEVALSSGMASVPEMAVSSGFLTTSGHLDGRAT